MSTTFSPHDRASPIIAQIISELKIALEQASSTHDRNELSVRALAAIRELFVFGSVDMGLHITATLVRAGIISRESVFALYESMSGRLVAYFHETALLHETQAMNRITTLLGILAELDLPAAIDRSLRQSISQAFKPGAPVAPDVESDVLRMAERLSTQLAAIKYPPNLHVSVRWREIVDRNAAVMRQLGSAYLIVWLGIYHGAFRPMSYLPDDRIRRQLDGFREVASGGTMFGPFDLSRSCEIPQLLAPSIETRDGLRHSGNSASYAVDLAQVGQCLPANDEYRTCLEISTGYGGFARQVKLALPGVTYFLVDVPGSLAFAYAYLRIGLPEARCLVIEDASQAQGDWWQDYDFVFCPMQLYGSIPFPKIDLGFSFWNLGEMRQECVDYFFEGINGRIDFRRFIFWNNIFVNSDLLNEASGETGDGCLATFKFGAQWRPRHMQFQSTVGNPLGDDQRDIYRNNLFAMMENVADLELDSGWRGAGEINDVIRLYCRALWSKDAQEVANFCDLLEKFLATKACSTAPTYRLAEIGEVRYLRHAAEESRLRMAKCN